jgi:hypothetical protein
MDEHWSAIIGGIEDMTAALHSLRVTQWRNGAPPALNDALSALAEEVRQSQIDFP